MSFCASCGRQRVGTAPFCAGCGAQFTDPPEAQTPQAQQPPAEGTPGADAPLASPAYLDPVVTRAEPSAGQTDPFASWYQQEAPPAQEGAEPGWQPTQTVQATPAQAGGYVPPSYPPPAPPPQSFTPGPAATPPRRGGGGKGLFITVAVVVVLAAGGGAYALASSLGKHGNAQPPAQPTVSASATAPGTTPPATSAAPSPTPSPALSLVAISPSVSAGAAGPQVETLLSHYFHGINSHSYPEYASTLNAEAQAKQPQSQFESGYSSTTDSGMTLTSLSDSGSGGLTATVSFTSRQSPSQSVDKSPCNAWTLNLYLVPQGSGYLIGPSPAGYQPVHSDC